MTIAIISATKEKETDGVPYAFLPIFSDYSIEWQIKSASHLGIDHFIFVSANLSGVLLNLVDSLRKQGVTADIVRDCKELSLTLPPENTDPLLFLDDGVGFEPAYLQQFLAARIPVLLVTEHDDKTAYLERIDLNHRWTGIALFAPNLMENMADVPADWDVGSALLRAAIQSDYRREVLTTETVVQGSLYHIQTRADGAKFELRRLAEYRSLPGHSLGAFGFAAYLAAKETLFGRALAADWCGASGYIGGCDTLAGTFPFSAAADQLSDFFNAGDSAPSGRG